MRARRNPRHCSARLPLRTGADDHQMLARHKFDIPLRDEIGQIPQITNLTRRRHGAVQRPANNGNRPVIRLRRLHDRVNARHITGKTSHRDTARCLSNHLFQPLTCLRLGPSSPFDHRVGGITDHRQNTLRANLGKALAISVGPQNRRFVEFPVTGVQDNPSLSANGKCSGIWDRMAETNQLNVEGANLFNRAHAKFD